MALLENERSFYFKILNNRYDVRVRGDIVWDFIKFKFLEKLLRGQNGRIKWILGCKREPNRKKTQNSWDKITL